MTLLLLPRSSRQSPKITLSFWSHFLLSPIVMIYKFIVENCTLECDLKTVFQPGPKSSIGSKPILALASSPDTISRCAKKYANG